MPALMAISGTNQAVFLGVFLFALFSPAISNAVLGNEFEWEKRERKCVQSFVQFLFLCLCEGEWDWSKLISLTNSHKGKEIRRKCCTKLILKEMYNLMGLYFSEAWTCISIISCCSFFPPDGPTTKDTMSLTWGTLLMLVSLLTAVAGAFCVGVEYLGRPFPTSSCDTS